MSGGDATRFGKYKILKHIAAGGMGEVHLAKLKGPVGFEKLVVIKRLLDHRQNEPKYIDMFFSEARVAAQLTHSNIAQVYEVGNYEGVHYIAMEYVQGKSLRKILDALREQHSRLPPAYAIQIISELCAGLAFAHNARHLSGAHMDIIHRDINPHNVLISYHGEVKIIDFGIAKSELSMEKTRAGTIKGTVVYMSPEQSHGKKLDKRSDIFSVGICLYESLTGTNPFHKESLAASLEAIRDATYPPVESHDPELAVFAPLVSRALARVPEERYQDCLELAEALKALLDKGIVPRPTVPLSRFLASLFADDINDEERLLSRTELAELVPLGRTDTFADPTHQPSNQLIADEKTVADSPETRATVGMSSPEASAGSEGSEGPDDGFAPTGVGRELMASVPTVKTIIPVPESERPMHISASWRLPLRHPLWRVSMGTLALGVVLGGLGLLLHPATAPHPIAPQPNVAPSGSPMPDPAPSAEPKAAPSEVAKPDAGKPATPANNTAPATASNNTNEPPSGDSGEPTRRHRTPTQPPHRHPPRPRQVRPETPTEPPASPPAYPMLQLFLDPSTLKVSLNGTPTTSSMRLRQNVGTLKIGTGTNNDTDPFIITIRYHVEGKTIAYSVESEPWANVVGAGGISLGRTPLQNLHGESTTVLELHNPHVNGTPRITLHVVMPGQ